MTTRRALAAAFVLFFLVAGFSIPVGAIEEPKTNVHFDDTINVQERTLNVTGAGVRKKTFVGDIYAAALYVDSVPFSEALARYRDVDKKTLEKDEAFYATLVHADVAKAIVLRFVRDVDAGDMRDALEDGIKKNMTLDEDAKRLINQIQTDFKKGDRMTISFAPGGETSIGTGGTFGKPVKNQTLSEAVQKIWFGLDPISDEIKKGAVDRIPAMLR
jgi:hypothetical protein